MALGRRRLLHGSLATAALAVVGRPAAEIQDSARVAMARAAGAFVATLAPAQRPAAVFAFGNDERLNWHYVPRGRAGLAFKDMTSAARAAAHELLKASLSS